MKVCVHCLGSIHISFAQPHIFSGRPVAVEGIIIASILLFRSKFFYFIKNIFCKTQGFSGIGCTIEFRQSIYCKSLGIYMLFRFDRLSFMVCFPVYSAKSIIYKIISKIFVSQTGAVQVKVVSKGSIGTGKSP